MSLASLRAAAPPGHEETALAGRLCPADYRYAPSVLDRPPDLTAEVLYVVGGLYGNLAALDAVERLAAAERAPVTIVLNGDFHWFDAEPRWFAEIDRRGAGHIALRGNVETEIARPQDVGAGCGCAYPETVGVDVVTRSNEILSQLRAVATPEQGRNLAALPMHLVAAVGYLRVGIVHGDAAALAGWRFAQDALDDPASLPWLDAVRTASRVDLFASTHTCLAALRDLALPGGRLTVVNNGSAGMGNFADSHRGLISRIATRPSPHPSLYGLARDGIFIDAVEVDFDRRAFLAQFLRRWPGRSAAHLSYFKRILAGPDYTIGEARLRIAT